MLTQEEFMDVLAMRRQGLSISEIADETGYHPATISKWLKAGSPPPARAATTPAAIDARWSARIDELLRAAPLLLATSVFEILRTERYTGSYPSVVRDLRARRGPRFKGRAVVSTRIETPPGEEAQFDFSDAGGWGHDGGIPGLVCFSAMLSWSRWRWWWFTTSEDREHTFEGLVRCFEPAGGVPKVLRTDRMGTPGLFAGPQVQAAPPGPGVRPVPWHGDPGVPLGRRQAQGEGGATVPHLERDLLGGAAPEPVGQRGRAQLPGRAVAGRPGACPDEPDHRGPS